MAFSSNFVPDPAAFEPLLRAVEGARDAFRMTGEAMLPALLQVSAAVERFSRLSKEERDRLTRDNP